MNLSSNLKQDPQNYESLKMRQWQLSLAVTPPDNMPVVPTITIEDRCDKPELERYYRARDWESCLYPDCKATGTETKLLKCGGCCSVPGEQVLYCSRECQRADWARHKNYCRTRAANDAEWAAERRIDVEVWCNCSRMELKRTEGLSRIVAWILGQIYLQYPTVDWKTTCLSIRCQSSRHGRGKIFPESFQLIPLKESYFGVVPVQLYDAHPDTLVVAGQLIIDGVYQEPIWVDIMEAAEEAVEMKHHCLQWPWVFSTIALMKNYNGRLAGVRLLSLAAIVRSVVAQNKLAVLHFQVPDNFANGEIWHPYDWQAWHNLFGHVIGF